MFAIDEVTLPVRYAVATRRLTQAVAGNALSGVSTAAYEHGWAATRYGGPAAWPRRAAPLARVRALPPVRRGALTTVVLRWEARGTAQGATVPVLDADLILMPNGADGSRLGVVGSYRLPLDGTGAGGNRVAPRRLTAATMRSLLWDVANLVAAHPSSGWAATSAAPARRSRRPANAQAAVHGSRHPVGTATR